MTSVNLSQGQFHWVRDDVIVLPEDREREPHASRGCVIVEGDESLALGSPVIQIIPTSSQTSRKGPYDVLLPSPPLPGDGGEYVALVRHLQPIRRDELKSFVVPLPRELVDKMLAAHLLALGVKAEQAGEDTEAEDIPF